MIYSIDFGGSTIDVVSWRNARVHAVKSFERYEDSKTVEPMDFLKANRRILKGAEKIFVTGGRSRILLKSFNGIPLEKVNEIEAIGRGGYALLKRQITPKQLKGIRSVLVVSMGTGTCMVKAMIGRKGFLGAKHVGGTGVGGGTFMGLSKLLLVETSPASLKKMFARGDRKKVDLSVYDIVGSGIGLVPADATASNLAKISRSIEFSKSDLAAGIVNLVGHTIGVLAAFAAKAHKCDLVLLCGKLTLMEQVTAAALASGKIYGVKMLVPPDGGFISALGAKK